MGFIFSLAMKNLFRYKRRTFITAITIAAGLSIYIWVDAFMSGIELDSQRNMMWYETGTAQVINKQYFEERNYMPLDYVLEAPDSIMSVLKENKISATKRITAGGELFFYPAGQEAQADRDEQADQDAPGPEPEANIDRSRNIKLFGIDLATVDNVFRIKDVLMDKDRSLKTLLANNPDKNDGTIILGRELCNDMKIRKGNTVQFRTRNRDGNQVVLQLTVAGLLNCSNPVVNKSIGFMSLSVLDELLAMEGAVTDIPVLFPEWEDSKKTAVKTATLLAARFQGLEVKDWDDMSGNIMYAQSKKKMISILLLLVAVIAAVGIINTMLMAVFERIREIGMMRAMGMLDKEIRHAFLFEAGGIGLIGSFFGVLTGFLLTFYSVYWGFDFSPILGNMDIGYRVYGVFRASWNPATMIISFILGVLASVLVALYPASKALKIEITDCLRHQ